MLGTPEETAALREAVRKLRDTERAPVNAPKVQLPAALPAQPSLPLQCPSSWTMS